MSEPTKDTQKEALDQIQKVARAQFATTFKVVRQRLPTLTNRGIRRAIESALLFKITDEKLKFRNQAEAELAGLLARLFDLRTVLQGGMLKELELINNEDETDESNNTTDETVEEKGEENND
jgi:hypothetical protein